MDQTSIPESARPPLSAAILTLRIIVFALAAGVLSFGAFAVFQNAGKPQMLAGKLDQENIAFLTLGVVALVLGLLIPPLIFRSAKPPPVWPQQFAEFSPEALRVLGIQGRIQTATIVGCAIFEGGAFLNVFGYLYDVELLHLALAGVVLLGILSRFPFPGACERKIENELRRLREEEMLRPVR